ncbi:MAG: ornithine cyclodeaminase family protein [Alphaproteobacteria bacterium]|nr:ornithine cyclodeaminase family protein [Alphaproteobacteria bacterium]
MSNPALWITEAEVVRLVGMPDAIDAVERGLLLEAQGDAVGMGKTFVRFGAQRQALQALGAAFPSANLAATKTWVQSPDGGWPQLILFDTSSGHRCAVIEATALSQLRTGALAGIATRLLADARADEMAVIGSGRQAWTQVAAVAVVRKLRRLRVWSPTPAHRQRFAARMREAFDFEIVESPSAAAASEGAPVVTAAAHVTTPVLSAAMLASGAHVNAVSVTVSGRAELQPDVLPRCGFVCADSPEAVRDLSDEFRAYYGARNAWNEVRSLAATLANGVRRPRDADLTLYKGMGSGIADLALAIEVLARARQQGVGHRLPDLSLADPRLSR